MSNQSTWRFTETRPIRPFKTSPHALDGVQCRVLEDAPFLAEQPWKVLHEPEVIQSPHFRPSFKVSLDARRLETETGISSSDLMLSLVIRDPGLLTYECIANWPVDAAPETYDVADTTLRGISGFRGVSFVFQISPARQLPPSPGIAHRPAHVVASATFDVAVPKDGSDFPVELVDPDAFEVRGFPPETIWAIDWRSEDFDQSAEDVLVVLINRAHADKLLRLPSSDSVGAVVWQQIAIDVILEICLVVFRSNPATPQQEDGLLGRIYSRLHHETGLDVDGLTSKAREPVGATSFFRSHLQKGLGLGDAMNRMSLAGRG